MERLRYCRTVGQEEPGEYLETPDRFGQTGRRHPKDWRGQDRDQFRSTQTVARLTALVVIPVTLVTFGLAASHTIAAPVALAVVVAAWLAGVAALWFGGRASRAQR